MKTDSLRPTEERLTLDTEDAVYFYEQDHYYLSSFSAFRVKLHVDNVWRDFDTAEQAYHWFKFPESHELQLGILGADSAHAAFKFAERHRAQRRPDWDVVKVPTMREILRAKIRRHEYVRRKLLETGHRVLIENSWRDDFWGWGPNRDGKNVLGKLWMEVRDEVRAWGIV